MGERRPADSEPTHRVRTLMRAWCGGPLRTAEVAALVGIADKKAVHNAIYYLYRTGECRQVRRGAYAPAGRAALEGR